MRFDFSTFGVVDDISVVPEQFRPLYEETPEKKFALKTKDPVVKATTDAIVGLNKALEQERIVKRPIVDLTPLKDYGSTPEEILAKLEEYKEQLATSAKIDPKKIKDDIAGQFKKDLDAKDARISSLKTMLDERLIDSELKSAIAEAKGDVELLLPFARRFMRPVEADGRYAAAVVDEQGSARYSPVTGLPLTPAELIGEMKRNPKYGKLFEPTAPAGSATPPRGSARPTASPSMGDSRSPLDKIRAGLNSGKHLAE